MTSDSSTVMRPKSMATVVVVFFCTWVVSSTPADFEVTAASVVSGGISETAVTNVVLPTPKPPATTNFTEVIRPRAELGASEGPYTVDHPGERRELDLDGVGVMNSKAAAVDQIGDQHCCNSERNADFRGNLRDRSRLSAHLEDLRVLERRAAMRASRRVHERLHAKRGVARARASAGDDERPNEVRRRARTRQVAHRSTLSFSSATSAGVSAAPARSTSNVIW